MDQSLMYQQSKDTIKQSLSNSTHFFLSLVELFEQNDQSFNVLSSEMKTLDTSTDLRISAAELKDSYELIQDLMVDYAQMISSLAVDEVDNPSMISKSLDDIDHLKEISPEIQHIIYELSAQVADFNELFVNYEYHGVDSINPQTITRYMEANKKVSQISRILASNIRSKYSYLKDEVNKTQEVYAHNTYIYEAIESIDSSYFVSLIPDVSLIEVGKTKQEVKRKTEEYFDNTEDEEGDEYEIMPCSREVYNMFTIKGEIPEEWNDIDGVIVLPDEYDTLNDSDELKEHNTSNEEKTAIKRIRYEIKEYLQKNIESSFYEVKGNEGVNSYTVSITPDKFINDTRFTESDVQHIYIMARKLRDHPWVDELDVDKLRNGGFTISILLGEIDLSQYSLNLSECVSLNVLSENDRDEAIQLDERNADGTIKAILVWIKHGIEEELEKNLTVKHFKTGIYRKSHHVILEVLPDKIFGNGVLPDEDKEFIKGLNEKIDNHPWVESSRAEFPNSGEAALDIRLNQWNTIDIKHGFRL